MKPIVKLAACTLCAVLIFSVSCKKETSCEGCRENNIPPIAVAGPDRIVTLPTDSVSLDGTASSDADGRISKWQWTKISGPASFTIRAASAAQTVVKHLVTGSYEFELKVTDDKGLSAKDTLQLTVDAVITANHPPVARAGSDTTIILPANVANLDGSRSTDPDNNITSYAWSKISGPSSFNIANSNATQTPVTNLIEGIYLFELTVADSAGLSAKDTVAIIANAVTGMNHAPVAHAGADQTIALPVNAVSFDGSGSSDPDHDIADYAWTKISGPASFTMANTNSVKTQVTNLAEGIYLFQLKVTDAKGLFSMDTVQVTVLPVVMSSKNGLLIPFGTLSIARAGIVSATAGNKILFAGGFTTCGTVGSGVCNWYSRVDIYDMNTKAWSIAELSQARIHMGVATLGNKIFFAGGYISSDDHTSRVDIYDAGTDTWSIAELSEARINPATVSLGNKIYFGGGCPLNSGLQETPSSRLDVFDASTNTWSIMELGEARTSLAAASLGNNILFAGGWGHSGMKNFGFSKMVDSYNSVTNQWSIDSLSEARSGLVAAALSTKVFFAGGWIGGDPNVPAYSNKVDIYDNTTQKWAVAYLSQPAELSGAASDGTSILFFPYGSRMEVYNSVTNNWYSSELNQPLYGSSVVGAGGQIYVAGGALQRSYINYTSQVWRVQF